MVKAKRKKSNSPNSGRVVKPKVAKVNINSDVTNSQVSVTAPAIVQSSPAVKQSSSAVPQSSSATSQPSQSSPTQDAVGKGVKPVFANTNFQVIRNVLQSVQFTAKPLLKVRGSNSTQIQCSSVSDKKTLIAKLQSEQIGFHTFTNPADKPTYFLLKGFYQTSCMEVLSMLQVAAVPAIKVTNFIRNDDYVIYLVHFDKSVNVNLLNQSHKHVDGIVVKWDLLKKSNKKVTQCYHCQQWGHSGINCGYKPRCVKCNESHEKGACSRTTREGDPTCCNCGGAHASNHRGCPAYKKHLELIKARSKKPSVAAIKQNPVPLSSSVHFPQLVTQQSPEEAPVPSSSKAVNSSQPVSFARLLNDQSSPVNALTKLSEAQVKLNSLPNINETIDIFVRMVDELYACNDHEGRLNVLIKYTTSSSFVNHGS